MARLKFFEQDIRLKVAADLSPEAIARDLAAVAGRGLYEYMATHPEKPDYVQYVNGHKWRPLDQVVAPGPIVFEFNYLRQIALYGLAFLEARSPHGSGDYARHHFVMHDQARINPQSIPPDAEQIVLTNDSDYARKVHVINAMPKMKVPPLIFEDLRQAILARFGQVVEAQIHFLTLPWGYVLRREAKSNRKDRQKGMAITYPAVVIDRIIR